MEHGKPTAKHLSSHCPACREHLSPAKLGAFQGLIRAHSSPARQMKVTCQEGEASCLLVANSILYKILLSFITDLQKYANFLWVYFLFVSVILPPPFFFFFFLVSTHQLFLVSTSQCLGCTQLLPQLLPPRGAIQWHGANNTALQPELWLETWFRRRKEIARL